MASEPPPSSPGGPSPPTPFTPEAAGYRGTSLVYPCRSCRFFLKDPQAPNGLGTCQVVLGSIAPGATCVLWQHPTLGKFWRGTPDSTPGARNRLFTATVLKMAPWYSKLPVPDLRRMF